jgi:hypothetical protein
MTVMLTWPYPLAMFPWPVKAMRLGPAELSYSGATLVIKPLPRAGRRWRAACIS